jgi:hypothetical protein
LVTSMTPPSEASTIFPSMTILMSNSPFFNS